MSTDEHLTRLNERLHALLGVDEPCRSACTHVIDGGWTALGAANVLARHSRQGER